MTGQRQIFSCLAAVTVLVSSPTSAHGPSSLGDLIVSTPFIIHQKLGERDLIGNCSGQKIQIPSVDGQKWYFAGDLDYLPKSVGVDSGKTVLVMPDRPADMPSGGYGSIAALESRNSGQVVAFEYFWQKTGANTAELPVIADKYELSATPKRRGCIFRNP